ncbi:MAG: hypothetical protein V3U57_03470 [Robiginitomaculum sp.]
MPNVICYSWFMIMLGFLLSCLCVPLANSQDAGNHDTQQTSREFVTELPPEFQQDFPQEPARKIKPIKKNRSASINLSFLAPLFKVAFWGIIAAFALYILYSIISEAIHLKRSHALKQKSKTTPEIPTYHPDLETAKTLIKDADKLAAAGRFEEAVHMLLFRSIGDIERKRPHAIKRSLTSREISELSILTPKAKDGFTFIGRMVESSFFGGRRLGAQDYTRSKAAYENFAYEKIAK